MGRPTKALILGFLAGSSIASLGVVNSRRFDRQVADLRARCVAEDQREHEDPAVRRPTEFVMTCDLIELGRDTQTLVGIQQELAKAQRALWLSAKWPIPVGLGVMVFSALPWAWYFLLKRVRELRDVIVGD